MAVQQYQMMFEDAGREWPTFMDRATALLDVARFWTTDILTPEGWFGGDHQRLLDELMRLEFDDEEESSI